jgi:hypothetical protein
MFSLRETVDGKFIYRCHECGMESELMAADQAVAFSQSHKCAPKAALRNLRKRASGSKCYDGTLLVLRLIGCFVSFTLSTLSWKYRPKVSEPTAPSQLFE